MGNGIFHRRFVFIVLLAALTGIALVHRAVDPAYVNDGNAAKERHRVLE